MKAFWVGIWYLGRKHPGNQLAALALHIAGVLGSGEVGRLDASSSSLLVIPQSYDTRNACRTIALVADFQYRIY